MRWLLVLLVLLPGMAFGAPVVVTTGDHDGFTRIALDFGRPIDWEMGRTSDGYTLRILGETPDYDLTSVFDLIGKDRLSTLWVDPAGGDLRLGISCACYAMPFAFRPSIVVIDLKNGKPPQNSAFEEALKPLASADAALATPDAAAEFSATGAPPPRPSTNLPAGPAYDWVGARLDGSAVTSAATPDVPVTPLPIGTNMEPLRQALMEEMSRGAAAGLIDMSLPRDRKEGMVVTIPSARIHLGDAPNYATHIGENSGDIVTAEGESCVPEEALQIFDWADAKRPVAEQLAEPMTGLVGEFDKPDPEKVARAVKLNLYLGFGAEARALLRAFPQSGDDNTLWTSLGFIMDGKADEEGAFTKMAACDSSAALWAALSIPDLSLEPSVNTKAIARTFSALPPHLRQLLGPRLADQLLSINEDLAARSVRDAVTRLPGEKAPEVTLLEAKIDVAQGDLTAADARLAPLAAQSGPASEDAFAALIENTANQAKPISPDQVDGLAVLAQERRDGPDGARFETALILGRAAAGQFDEAFGGLERRPDLADRVWNILSVLGTDDDLVAHAILDGHDQPPQAAMNVAARVAERLLGLGFVDQAANWLAMAATPDPKLVARLALAQNDGAAALRAVAGIEDDEARNLKAQALTLSGNFNAAADVYKAMGQETDYWAAEGLAQDWPVMAAAGPDPWLQAAQALVSPEPASDQSPPGPLAAAQTLVVSSADTRAAIDALLTSVPVLDAATQ